MKYSVVVVEDELLLKENLIKKINSLDMNFEVIASAQTGIQGLELVKQYEPDVLITDIMMPVMNGLDLIREVHQQYPTTDCIIISGFSDFEFAKTAIHYQVTEYLLKPVDIEDLHNILLKLQHKYQLRKESYSTVFSDESNTLSPPEIAELLHSYIIENYRDDIKISQIAEQLNYSSSYMTKLFCQEYDCSPSKFLISIRIQHAKQILRSNQDLSVRQVGEAVGYPEQGYFSRIFKRHTGLSPNEYRESLT